MPTLCKTAKLALDHLMGTTGHTLRLTDLDDILRLNELGIRIEQPEDVQELELFSMPMPCGHGRLYPPSLGALAWLQSGPMEWFADDVVTLHCAVAYALGHAYQPAKIEALCDARAAGREARRWARAELRCSAEQVAAAIERLMPQADGEEAESHGYGPVVAVLCREYGESPSYWLWGCSADVIRCLLVDLAQRNEAEAESVRRSAARAGKAIAPTPSLRLKAHAQFQALLRQMEISWATP